MRKLLIAICAIGCWACIIWTAATYDVKAAAAVALALLLEAIIDGALMHEHAEEVEEALDVAEKAVAEAVKLRAEMEDDGK